MSDAARYSRGHAPPIASQLRNVVSAALSSATAVVEALLMWRRPALSCAVAVGWQLLLTCPELLPATLPLVPLAVLCHGHAAARRGATGGDGDDDDGGSGGDSDDDDDSGCVPPAISLPPSATQVVQAAAGLGQHCGGLRYAPPRGGVCYSRSGPREGGDGSDGGGGNGAAATAGCARCVHCGMFKGAWGFRCACAKVLPHGRSLEAAVAARMRQLDARDHHDEHRSHGPAADTDAPPPSPSPSHHHHHHAHHHHQHHADGGGDDDGGFADGVEGAVRRASAMARSGLLDHLDAAAQRANPLAPYLGPLQQKMGVALVHARAARAVVRWEDPVLSLWCCAACVAAAVALAALPTLLLSWRSLLRLLGLALFGPHMLVLGVRRRRVERAARALERRYQAAGTHEAAEMVEKLATERAAAAAVAATRAHHAADERATREWLAMPPARRQREEAQRARLEAAPYRFTSYASRAAAARYPLRPDPQTSRVTPMEAQTIRNMYACMS